MKGIILAGGRGTRLEPLTKGVCKQLLPVYNKPMVYYPLSMLMLAGIREILVISTPHDLGAFKRLLGDGKKWGLSFTYAEQTEPRGIADAFLVGKEFVADKPVSLVLGDNIFYGTMLPERLRRASQLTQGATVFAYRVQQPQHYAVITLDPISPHTGKALTLEEKPAQPKSRYAVPGLYFYDEHVVQMAEQIKPSKRGELEITDLNKLYLEKDQLNVEILGRGVAWLDAGAHESLLQAANFVQAVEDRQGMMISCPEEIAYRMGYITQDQLRDLGEEMPKNSYAEYLIRLANEEIL